jgi:hypothetical protein
MHRTLLCCLDAHGCAPVLSLLLQQLLCMMDGLGCSAGGLNHTADAVPPAGAHGGAPAQATQHAPLVTPRTAGSSSCAARTTVQVLRFAVAAANLYLSNA